MAMGASPLVKNALGVMPLEKSEQRHSSHKTKALLISRLDALPFMLRDPNWSSCCQSILILGEYLCSTTSPFSIEFGKRRSFHQKEPNSIEKC